MGKVPARAVVLLVVLVQTGCATLSYSVPQDRAVENRFVVEADVDRVWTAVVDAFADNSWPITTMDKASGFIAADEVSVPSSFMDCGVSVSDGRAVQYGYNYTSFNIVIREAETSEQTMLRVNTTMRGGVRSLAGLQPRQCVSTGLAEATIHDAVLQGIKG